jgi:hypothetical protein
MNAKSSNVRAMAAFGGKADINQNIRVVSTVRAFWAIQRGQLIARRGAAGWAGR